MTHGLAAPALLHGAAETAPTPDLIRCWVNKLQTSEALWAPAQGGFCEWHAQVPCCLCVLLSKLTLESQPMPYKERNS